VEHTAVKILNRHRIMAISTVRPDGWPQTTIVGYVNQGFDIYFLIFRSGQKLANIQHDDRISIAVAAEPSDMQGLQAVYAAAHAREITDQAERDEAWRLLMERASNLAGFNMPEAHEAAFMKATCQYVSVLDFSQGIGHTEEFTVDDSGTIIEGVPKTDGWASSAAAKEETER
jgi:nitroimidazol reductase NimA-like FMN-containing flavoprotein (pyridoxamine 5'-phosphate oxidase superfamily)